MSDADLTKAVQEIIKEVGATSIKEMGKVMVSASLWLGTNEGRYLG